MGYLLLAFAAFLGFAVSLWCHVLSWLHIDPPLGKTSMMLHFGIFAVFLPSMILANKAVSPSVGKKDGFSYVMTALPNWIPKTAPYLGAYFVFNFFYGMYLTSPYPKGSVPLYLDIRIFSGHWMLFYGMSALASVGLFRLSRKNRATNIEPPNNNP